MWCKGVYVIPGYSIVQPILEETVDEVNRKTAERKAARQKRTEDEECLQFYFNIKKIRNHQHLNYVTIFCDRIHLLQLKDMTYSYHPHLLQSRRRVMTRTRVQVALVTLKMNLRNLRSVLREKHRLGLLLLPSPRTRHMKRLLIPNNPQILLWPVQVTPKRMKGRPILLRLWIPPKMQRQSSSRKGSQPRKDMLKKRRLKV